MSKLVTRDELAELIEQGNTLIITPRLSDVPDLTDAYPAIVSGDYAHSVIGDFEWEFNAKDFAPRDMFYVYDGFEVLEAIKRLTLTTDNKKV